MKVRLTIQDALDDDARYVVDAISVAAVDASYGQAIFAFATVAGIELLFALESIRALVTKGRFDLIVGIDAITD